MNLGSLLNLFAEGASGGLLPPDEITVNGNNLAKSSTPTPPLSEVANVGDPNKITPRMLTQTQLDNAATPGNLPDRKGMFGVKGTLRDVLGLLGDSLLVGSGGKGVYAPQRQQERLADSMAGMPAPDYITSAIRENPEAGFKMYQEYLTDMQKEAAAKLQGQNLQLEGQKASDKNFEQYSKLYSQYMGSATPETYGKLRPMLELLKQRGGLGEEFILPEEYDANLARSYQYGGMPAQNQVNTYQRGQTLEETKRHNRETEKTGRISATKPRASTRPRADSELEYYRAITSKPENQRDPDEQAFVRKYLHGTKGEKGSRRSVTYPTSGSTGWGTARKIN